MCITDSSISLGFGPFSSINWALAFKAKPVNTSAYSSFFKMVLLVVLKL